MSELMDRAVIGMPYEMAMGDELSRRQFYARAQALLAEREALREALECLLEMGHAKAGDLARAAMQGAQP